MMKSNAVLSNQNSTSPIKINTSMTTMAKVPDHNINSLSSPNSMSLRTPWSPKSPVTPNSMSPKSAMSPKSPVSPISPRTQHVSQYSLQNVMKKKGYIPFKSLGSTLQGSIWKVKSSKVSSAPTSVIKVTKKTLHNKSVAVINGAQIEIKEDVIKETAILRYLTSNKPPTSLAKFESFFSDKKNYFLVMEDGGSGLFEFVAKCHKFISSGKLDIKEWHRFCKIAFKQIVELLHWMHNKMNCCHLDISLENFVIDNVMVMIEQSTDKIIFSDNFVVKMVDFGLAEVFTSSNENGKIDFRCTKYVGKTAYKAPKVYGKRKVFDARSADCWSLGVVLFMMIVGGTPYKKPSKNDASFGYIMSGKIIELLDEWERLDYVTPKLVDLMLLIFKEEEQRLNIDEIKKHPWLL